MRPGRIELPPARWQRAVLPLNYGRSKARPCIEGRNNNAPIGVNLLALSLLIFCERHLRPLYFFSRHGRHLLLAKILPVSFLTLLHCEMLIQLRTRHGNYLRNAQCGEFVPAYEHVIPVLLFFSKYCLKHGRYGYANMRRPFLLRCRVPEWNWVRLPLQGSALPMS